MDSGEEELPPYSRLSSAHSSVIFSTDEYLEFPERLSTASASPVRAAHLDPLDCPHLLHDFGQPLSLLDASPAGPSTTKTSSTTTTEPAPITSADIEQWTEIRLSNSESTSSGYSQHSQRSSAAGDALTTTADGDEASGGRQTVSDDDADGDSARTMSSTSTRAAKVTCHTIFGRNNSSSSGGGNEERSSTDGGGGGGLTGWITKSNLKQSGRRQSLDILLDAGDRVKDVFATGFQRVGKSLERRNSESEVSELGGAAATTTTSTGVTAAVHSSESSAVDFFSFGGGRSTANDVLSDEQVENLLLSEDCAEMLRNLLNISK